MARKAVNNGIGTASLCRGKIKKKIPDNFLVGDFFVA